MGAEIKHLNFEEKTFVANGKTYRIDDSISFERWQEYEKLEVHVGYGCTFQQMFDTDKKIYEAMNKVNFVEASAMLYNRMQGIKDKLEKRTHPALLLCALFINFEGEEITKYDSNIAEQKIKDWSEEGFAVQDFFSLAVNLVNGFIPAYKNLLENTLKKQQTEKPSSSSNGV